MSGSLLCKSKWTPQEDQQLRSAVAVCGTESWIRVANVVATRTGKQCRERWTEQIAPIISKDEWLPEEDAVLMRAHDISGNRWTSITTQLPGRSPLNVKNRWHWLKRHGNVKGGRSRGIPEQSDLMDTAKPCREAFEPLGMDEGWFGEGFQEFRATMLTGDIRRS
jgi:myb proto-oncogene protein